MRALTLPCLSTSSTRSRWSRSNRSGWASPTGWSFGPRTSSMTARVSLMPSGSLSLTSKRGMQSACATPAAVISRCTFPASSRMFLSWSFLERGQRDGPSPSAPGRPILDEVQVKILPMSSPRTGGGPTREGLGLGRRREPEHRRRPHRRTAGGSPRQLWTSLVGRTSRKGEGHWPSRALIALQASVAWALIALRALHYRRRVASLTRALRAAKSTRLPELRAFNQRTALLAGRRHD